MAFSLPVARKTCAGNSRRIRGTAGHAWDRHVADLESAWHSRARHTALEYRKHRPAPLRRTKQTLYDRAPLYCWTCAVVRISGRRQSLLLEGR